MRVLVLNGWAAREEAWSLCAFRRESVFSYVDQLDGAADAALASGDGPAILVGWSMGGSTALRLFIEQPDRVASLVLVASTPRMMAGDGWQGMSERRLAALEYGLKVTRGEGFFGLPPNLPNPYVVDDDAKLRRGLDFLHGVDLRQRLESSPKRGEIPVRIFQSERDGIVRRSNADYLASVFTNSTVTIVPGGEHALPITVPAEIDRAVAELQQAGC